MYFPIVKASLLRASWIAFRSTLSVLLLLHKGNALEGAPNQPYGSKFKVLAEFNLVVGPRKLRFMI